MARRFDLRGWLATPDRIELLATVILSLALIAAAWSGFQSAKWSGEQAILFNSASATRADAVRASTAAGQQAQIDASLFVDWVTALDNDARTGLIDVIPGVPYEPDPTTLSGFLFTRFRAEFVPAVEAWLDTQPLANADAPKSPFDLPEYTLAAANEANQLIANAEAQAAGARQANQNSDNYVLTSVLFSLVLFFAGICTKLRLMRSQILTLCTAMVGLAAGIVILLILPIHAL